MFNAHHGELSFTMPPEEYGAGWVRVLDTADDLALGETVKARGTFGATARSMALFRRTGEPPR